ncbi:MAG: hypothetical protein C0410_02660 [Anaerolinea sp.]|nr:hypothetical protein [Anaerolinea sp.]
MSKIRVALGTVYPYDESHIRGGVEAVALYLTHALANREDLDLHVVSCNRTINRDEVEKRGHVTFHWIATRPQFYVLRALTLDAWRVRRVYRKIQPDVIHVEGFSEYSVAADNLSPMLLAVHGLEFLVPRMARTNHYRGLPGLYRRIAVMQMARKSLANARAVISNSGDYTATMLARWLNSKHVYQIGNPISANFFKDFSETVPSHPPVILWVGTITERKDVIGLIEVFALVAARFPLSLLVMTGSVADATYFERVKERILALGLLEKVSFKGFIEQQELLKLYRQATLVVMTSLEETAPMTIAQAMAAGKPVVATYVGGIPWMIAEGVSGYLVNVGDVQGMTDCIIRVLEDDTARYAMGQAAHARAMRLFNPDAVAAQTVQAYYDLIGLIHD